MVPGWVTGWVYQVGNTGTPTQPARFAARRTRQPATGGSGPSLQGRVGWMQGPGITVFGGVGGYPHPPGPVGPALQALPGDTLRNAASGPIWRD